MNFKDYRTVMDFAKLLQVFVTTMLLFFLISTGNAQKAPTSANVHLNNGMVQRVMVHSANTKGIMWTGRGALSPKFMAHSQIAKVDFPEPDLWKQGNRYFFLGEYSNAIAAFSSLANNPQGSYYPVPGNYTSLARLRLFECYREMGNARALVKIASQLNAKSLPKADRDQMDVVASWVELSKGNLNGALEKAEALVANPLLSARNDLGFIEGVAYEKTGKPKEAVIAYGAAYTVDFGGSRDLSKRAMKNAIMVLIGLNDEKREGELHSLVHTYAKVYNQGKLWDGAPSRAVQLLAEELGGDYQESEPDDPKSKPEGDKEKKGGEPAGMGG